MGKIYVGDSNGKAQLVKKVYVGVNGVAKAVKKAYVGVNGVAQLIYSTAPSRVYLWSLENGDNSSLTGGWSTGTFYHQTNTGTNYSMTRMAESIWQGYHLLAGSYSSTDGKTEKAMFAKTTNPIDFTPYSRLVAQITRNTTRDTAPTDAWFGVFNSQASTGLTCRSSELGTKFLAYATHSGSVTSGSVGLTLTIDISRINGSYILLYDNYHSNMNASISINIEYIYLE